MRYRIVRVHSNETGLVLYYRAEYREWWWPWWKPICLCNSAGQSDSYNDALLVVAKAMVSPKGGVKVTSEFV